MKSVLIHSDQERVIRLVGRNMGFETALRGCVTFVFRFLMGTLSGLPPTVMSVNAFVSFVSTALLEMPAGIFADLFGRVLSTRAGCWFQSLAALSLFAAIAVHEFSPPLMWFFVILEGVFDSLGNACLSGAREALYQAGVINLSLRQEEELSLRKRILAMAERYGVVAIGFAPPTLVLLTVAIQATVGAGHATLLGISVGWFLLATQFKKLARELKIRDDRVNQMDLRNFALKKRLISMRQLVVDVKDTLQVQRHQLVPQCLVYVIGWFAAVTASAYLPVAIARSLGADHPFYKESIVGLTAIFCIGRVLRAFILPPLLKNLGFLSSLLWSSALLTGIGIVLSFLMSGDDDRLSLITSSLVMMTATDMVTGIILKVTTGEILSLTPHSLHATLLSSISSVSFLTQGVYSLVLSFFYQGCPSPHAVATTIALCGGTAFLLVIYLRQKEGPGGFV